MIRPLRESVVKVVGQLGGEFFGIRIIKPEVGRVDMHFGLRLSASESISTKGTIVTTFKLRATDGR